MKMHHNVPEGATPIDDYSGLKVLWVQNREQLDAIESENINEALKKYLLKKKYSFPDWFTVGHFNLVHKEMFGHVWQWAGKYRRTEKSIGVVPHRIVIEMRQLQEDLAYWGKECSLDEIEIAVHVHHRLVWIHPYENGNGRHARLIGDMILTALHYTYPQWPSLVDQGNERNRYLEALRAADKHNFTPLKKYLISLGVSKVMPIQ